MLEHRVWAGSCWIEAGTGRILARKYTEQGLYPETTLNREISVDLPIQVEGQVGQGNEVKRGNYSVDWE